MRYPTAARRYEERNAEARGKLQPLERGERALGGLAERRDYERVRLWGDADEVPRGTLRRRAGLEQQLSGQAMGGVSFNHI